MKIFLRMMVVLVWAVIAGDRLIPALRAGEAQPPPAPVAQGESTDPEDGGPAQRGPLAYVYSTDQAIRLFHDRVKQHPHDFDSYVLLGGLYVRKARETGDVDSYRRAEAAVRRALELFPTYARAQASLAAVLYAEHQFAASLELARQVYQKDRGDLDALAIMGDASLELGDYAAAEAAYHELRRQGSQAAVLARLGRLAELKGRTQEALDLLQHALDEARTEAVRVGWFQMRVGNCLAAMGRVDEAERSYRAALAINPRDYRTLAALTRLAAGRGNWKATIVWGRRATRIVPMPETIGLIGDAYAALGNPKEARDQYELVEAIGTLERAQGGLYDRQLVLFDADHHRHLDDALALARLDLKRRHDLYAYDTLAWVCYQKGLRAEARTAIERAMALGTQDASLFYHAGMIAYASGDRATARIDLARALSINPYFHPFAPGQARRLLAQLR